MIPDQENRTLFQSIKDIMIGVCASVLLFAFSLLILSSISGFGSIPSIFKSADRLAISTLSVVLEEAKYFWGGSWFKRDKISISSTGFFIEKDSLFAGKNTLQMPYTKVKKVFFVEGRFISKFAISSEGWIFDDTESFFIRDKGNFQLVKDIVSAYSNNQVTIVEKKSLMCRFIGCN